MDLLTTTIGAYGLYKTIDLYKTRGERKLRKDFRKALIGAGIHAMSEIKGKNQETTFDLHHIKKTNFGYEANLFIPPGACIEDFEKENKQKKVETYLGCKFYIKELESVTRIKFITKPLQNTKEIFPFNVVECEPYELYFGKTDEWENIISTMKIDPHCMNTGANNMGKTTAYYTAILNLVLQYDETKVQLYLTQLIKNDWIAFKNIRNTKYYANGLKESVKMLKELEKIGEGRDKYIDIEKGISSIYDYNKKHPKNPLPIIYVIFEEAAFYMPDNKVDIPEEADDKAYCMSVIKKIHGAFRYVGIYALNSLQRNSTDCFVPTVKNNCNTVISFKHNNDASAKVALDNTHATELKPHEFIIQDWQGERRGKTPYLDTEMIMEHLKSLRATKEVKGYISTEKSTFSVTALTEPFKKPSKEKIEQPKFTGVLPAIKKEVKKNDNRKRSKNPKMD